MRRILLSILSMILFGAALTGAPPANAADVSVVQNAFNQRGTPDVLQVDFLGDTEVATIKATLTPQRAQGGPTIVVTDFDIQPRNPDVPQKTIATSKAPIRPSTYNYYDVAIEATDTDGNQLPTSPDAYKLFNWLVRPIVGDLTASRTELDFDHRSVEISGTATATNPVGEPVSMAGRKAEAILNGAREQLVTLDADGAFRVTLTHTGQPSPISVSVQLNSTEVLEPELEGTAGAGVDLTVLRWPMRLSLSAPATRVRAGSTVTVTGLAEAETAAGWGPRKGVKVRVGGGRACDPLTEPATITTGEDGRFSLNVKVTSSMAIRSVLDLSDPIDQVYLGAACGGPLTFTAVQPLRIDGFLAGVDAQSQVTVSGKAVATGLPTGTPVIIEYSSNGKTGWKKASSLKTDAAGAFKGRFRAPIRRAHYRARVAEQNTFYGATSRTRFAGRTDTRFVKFKVAPTKVRKNAYFTVSGTLQHLQGTWKPFPKQQVWILLRFRGGKEWFWYKKPLTDRQGRFSFRVKAWRDASWIPAYYGGPGHYLTLPKNAIFVDVR